jgi:hypothetical protein
MARTNATDVKVLIETSLSDADVDNFIADANALLTSSGIEDAECHDSASLTVLEKYLAAHFVALRERQLKSEKMGDATDQYGGNFDMGLDFTQYGQQAIMFDCSGILQSLDGVPFAFESFGGSVGDGT